MPQVQMTGFAGKIGEAIETIRAGLAATRTQIEEKRAELEDVRSAPNTRDDAIARLDGWIAGISEQYRPMVGDFVRPDAGVTPLPWPEAHRDQGVFLVAMFGRTIRAALVKEIDQVLESEGAGLTRAERAAAVARLEAELLELEVAEETTIRQAEAVGVQIPRRADADPRVVVAKLDI